jgi:SMC interacting uncharacterized protein involved in chromosome segregation
MAMDEEIKKIKGLSWVNTQNILITMSVVLTLSVIFLGYMSYKAPSASAMVILQTQNEILKKNLNDSTLAINKKIKDLETKLKKSQVIVDGLSAELKKVRDQYASITTPKTKQETINRFNAVGYHPR